MKVKACRSGTSANTYLSLSGSRACMPKCVWSATIRPTRQIERKKRRAVQVVVGADAAERRIYYCSDGQQAFLRPLACKAMLAGPLSHPSHNLGNSTPNIVAQQRQADFAINWDLLLRFAHESSHDPASCQIVKVKNGSAWVPPVSPVQLLRPLLLSSRRTVACLLDNSNAP